MLLVIWCNDTIWQYEYVISKIKHICDSENRRCRVSRGKESIALLYWMLAREVEATELFDVEESDALLGMYQSRLKTYTDVIYNAGVPYTYNCAQH